PVPVLLHLPLRPLPPPLPYSTRFRSGVERIVHVSILNPRGVEAPEAEAPDAGRIARGLSYYRGKAEVEEALGRITREAGMSAAIDRKSTRLNSSHVRNSYAGFCLRKK